MKEQTSEISVLPIFPRVFTDETTVIIEKSNGEKIIWGNEITEKTAIKVAEELEFELRLMTFIKT